MDSHSPRNALLGNVVPAALAGPGLLLAGCDATVQGAPTTAGPASYPRRRVGRMSPS